MGDYKSPTKKIEIALFLINRQFIRSWIESGLITKLEETGRFQVTVFAQDEVFEKLPSIFQSRSISIGSVIPSKFSKYMVAIGLVHCAKKSSTFKFKIARQFLPETWFIPKGVSTFNKLKWAMRSSKRILGNLRDNWQTLVYFIVPIRVLIIFFMRMFSNPKNLPKEMTTKKYDWLIMPTASSHGLITDLIRSANKCGLKTLVAIDNWDQLTGKSNFPVKPTFFTVMGQRCVDHAIQIHDCQQNSVLPFGLPRFDVYREISHSCSTSQKQIKRILYCGVALAHSEKFVVDQIAAAFNKELLDGTIELHYRPHPGPSPRYDDYKITNADVVTTTYGDLSQTAMPAMDREFLDVIYNADIIVGAPTTLILEALICNRKVVLDLTTDRFHRTTAGVSALRHTHIRDLTDVPTIPRGNSIPELISLVKFAINDPTCCVRHEIKHLYNRDEPLYRQQLAQFLSKEII
jgi:hypothetical protein